MKKIFLVFISFLIVCLPFSLCANAVQADAFFGMLGASSYYYKENSVVTEKYYNYDTYLDTDISLGSDLKLLWNYSDADFFITALNFTFFFPDDSYIIDNSYRLSFNTPHFLRSDSNYFYGYIFDDESNGVIVNQFFQSPEDFYVDATPYPVVLNNDFINSLKSINSTYLPYRSKNGRTDLNTPFSWDISFSSNFTPINNSFTVLIYFFMNDNKTLNNNYPYLELTDISLEPIGTTKYKYADKEYQENVLAASQSLIDSINEVNGSLNNIASKLFENGVEYDPVPNAGKVNDLINAESSFVKNHSAELDNQFNAALNIFDNNQAFAFISSTMDDLVLNNPLLNGVVIFSLAIGLCVLILGKKT